MDRKALEWKEMEWELAKERTRRIADFSRDGLCKILCKDWITNGKNLSKLRNKGKRAGTFSHAVRSITCESGSVLGSKDVSVINSASTGKTSSKT